jgi:3-mercaptopyruvate sulfurtransferase SseA
VAQEFIKAGYPKVFVLKGGWKAWYKAGYPTEKK